MVKAVLADQGVIDGQPILAVSFLEPEHEWDSGFALWSQEPDDISSAELLHLDCLFDDEPDIGEALGIAHKHGLALRNGNDWHPGGGSTT
jgi:hypothetical protein